MASWYPFRSQEVADITSHMTADELLSFRAMGIQSTFRMAIIIGILAAFYPQIMRKGFGITDFFSCLWMGLIVGAFVGVILGTTYAFVSRKRTREFLCSTQYAKQADYSSDSLRLYRFGF